MLKFNLVYDCFLFDNILYIYVIFNLVYDCVHWLDISYFYIYEVYLSYFYMYDNLFILVHIGRDI